MKESLKWQLLYNKYFPSNNKKLFERVVELEKEGKIELVKQKDYCNSRKKIMRLLNYVEDMNEILTYSARQKEWDKEELVEKIIQTPHRYLTSVISVWEYDKEITRLDSGVNELKYLLKGNYLWK